MIRRNRRMLTPHMLKLLINAHVNSITDYCIAVWGPSRVNDLKLIQSKINELLVVYFYPNTYKYYTKRFWKAQSDVSQAQIECRRLHKVIDYYELLDKCNQFTVSERLQYFCAWGVYKNIKFTSPIVRLREFFNCNLQGSSSQVSQRSTRSASNCAVTTHNTKLFENSVQYYSIKLWNSLPQSIKNFETTNVNVKRELNEWILNNRANVFVQ
jgi:hypothetical protein